MTPLQLEAHDLRAELGRRILGVDDLCLALLHLAGALVEITGDDQIGVEVITASGHLHNAATTLGRARARLSDAIDAIDRKEAPRG